VSSVIVGGAGTPIGKLLGGFTEAFCGGGGQGDALIITFPADGNSH
jgi:hypothetical protein